MQFVVGYPRSGTTWIRAVIAAYALDDVTPDDFMTVREDNGPLSKHLWDDLSLHHYQSSTPFALKNIAFANEVRLRPAAMMLLNRDISRAPGRDLALVHSHHAHCSVNGIHLWNPQWTTRVVNPIRDPRAICCSLAARFGVDYAEAAAFMADSEAQFPPEDPLNGEADGAASGSADHAAHDRAEEDEDDPAAPLHHLLLSWSNHIRSWTQPDHIDMLSVRYEDLCEDPVEGFRGIFEFLDVEAPESDRLEDAVETMAFDRMRAAEAEHGFPAAADEQEHFFRSGQADGWTDELPPEVARTIEEDHGEMMAALGYL
jgi:LPS sulfotransferase NodH